MKNLIGLQPLADVIALSLQSNFISNEANGTSLLIIGKPETAKTSMIFNFSAPDFVSYFDEITQKKLIDEFIPFVQQKQKRVLLVPDLINCIEKQKNTRDQFLNMIKTGIDDTGIIRISTYHKQLALMQGIEGIKFTMITAITGGNFAKIYKLIRETGLLSRFIPFTFDYPIDVIKKIFDYIHGAKIDQKTLLIPKLCQKLQAIPNKPDLFREFDTISTLIGREYDGYGIRAQIGLQRLAKANAILNDRKEVTKTDIDKVIHLSNWINFKFNSIGVET